MTAAAAVALGLLAGEAGAPASFLQKTAQACPASARCTRPPRVTMHRGRLRPLPEALRLPWPEVTVATEAAPGRWWIGTTRGAARYDARSGRLEYFAGRRWLPHDHVTGIGFEGPRVVWIETRGGLGRIEWQPMTPGDKTRLFEERLRARHRRHGLVASSRLEVAGDLSTSRTVPHDNDGLWTALYVAAECFRYAAAGEPAARESAREGLAALLRLESITGVPGFPARSFIEVGREERPAEGQWRDTPDGRWQWKGGTSSDEIVGHFFAYAVFHELVADGDERAGVAAAAERVASHLLDHGLRLVDVDGKPTRWGRWAPEDLWAMPDDTGLGALEILSILKVAHRLSGKERFDAAYRGLITRERYHLLARQQKVNVPGRVNHSDDQLAFLSYDPLLRYETDPALREVYLQGLERSAAVERPERNPLFNFIFTEE